MLFSFASTSSVDTEEQRLFFKKSLKIKFLHMDIKLHMKGRIPLPQSQSPFSSLRREFPNKKGNLWLGGQERGESSVRVRRLGQERRRCS